MNHTRMPTTNLRSIIDPGNGELREVVDEDLSGWKIR